MGGGRFRGLASRLSYLRKQSKSGLRSNEGKWKAYSCSVGIFALSFVITLLIASLLTPTTITSAEENSSSSAQADGYSLSLSATSAVNLGLSVSDSDSMTVGLGNVSVTTTSPGYKLYISMTGDTTGLSGIADGISGNIPATSGTITSPTSLTRGTWGYAIPSSGVAHLVSSGFNTSYAEMSSTTPDSSKKFATPPVSSAPQLIAESSTATSSDNYPIYYGVMANSSTAPGDYSNTVMFTAVADAAVSDTLTLTPSSVNINTATAVTVKTSLYSTAGYANANIYFLTAAEKNSIVGTNVEALGKTPLTCSKTSNTPVTYSCPLSGQASQNTYYFYAKFPTYDKAYSSAFTVINPTYTVTVTNSNTTSGAASVQVPLNGSATVTVTPASGYYLSSVSCPSGYSCTGYSTSSSSASGQQTITITNNNTMSGGTLTLTGADPWASITQMQQMTTSACTVAPVGKSKTLTDARDSNTYTVKKLADGKCWMTQNLRLNGGTSGRTLTSSNSNVTSNFTLPAQNTGEWCTGYNDATCINTANNLYSGDSTYGTYYSWYAATAGTGTYSMTSGNAPSSICPKGWRLPTGSSSGEFQTLYNNYNSYDLMTNSSGPAFVLSGYRYGGGTGDQGRWGHYWSSTAVGADGAYRLRLGLSSSSVNPAGAYGRYNGFPVRCIAQ